MKPQPEDDDLETAAAAVAPQAPTGETSPAIIAARIVTGLMGLGLGAFFALIFALMSGLLELC